MELVLSQGYPEDLEGRQENEHEKSLFMGIRCLW
jgi:hypothetical protein